jgi:beta-lactam-binding protein with PASTA domain
MRVKFLSVLSLVGVVTAVGALITSCSTVKEYQKSRINDSEMTLANRKVEKGELNAQSYREGSSGANAGKTGGGCGCN